MKKAVILRCECEGRTVPHTYMSAAARDRDSQSLLAAVSQIHGTLKCAMLVCSLSEEGRPFLMFWLCLRHIHKYICGSSLNLSISAAFFPTSEEGVGTRKVQTRTCSSCVEKHVGLW